MLFVIPYWPNRRASASHQPIYQRSAAVIRTPSNTALLRRNGFDTLNGPFCDATLPITDPPVSNLYHDDSDVLVLNIASSASITGCIV